MLIRILIPDIPRSLRQKIRQHAYLSNELIIQQEIKRHVKGEEKQATYDKSAKHSPY